jgi:hypothetical protein
LPQLDQQRAGRGGIDGAEGGRHPQKRIVRRPKIGADAQDPEKRLAHLPSASSITLTVAAGPCA